MSAVEAWVPRLPYEATHLIEHVEIVAELDDGRKGAKHTLGLYDLTLYVREDDDGEVTFEPDIAFREVRTGETGIVQYRRYRAGDPWTFGMMLTDALSAAVDAHWPSIERDALAKMEG